MPEVLVKKLLEIEDNIIRLYSETIRYHFNIKSDI